MSLIVFPGPAAVESNHEDPQSVAAEIRTARSAPDRARDSGTGLRETPRIRRRGSLEQGRALEMLGHAVEYLVDSRLFLADPPDLAAEQQAVQLLMRASRAVFAECPEVISLRQRLKEWLSERLSGDAA